MAGTQRRGPQHQVLQVLQHEVLQHHKSFSTLPWSRSVFEGDCLSLPARNGDGGLVLHRLLPRYCNGSNGWPCIALEMAASDIWKALQIFRELDSLRHSSSSFCHPFWARLSSSVRSLLLPGWSVFPPLPTGPGHRSTTPAPLGSSSSIMWERLQMEAHLGLVGDCC